MIHSNGNTYDGEWADDKANGIGMFVHHDGTSYTGEWKDDKQHGRGKEVWLGGYYDGEF